MGGATLHEKLVVLSVDDDVEDVELLRHHLERIPSLEIELLHAGTLAEAERMLHEHPIDLVALDYQLEGASGLELLRSMRERGDTRPVLVLTARCDAYASALLMREGADGYMAKSDLASGFLEELLSSSRGHARGREQEFRMLRDVRRLVLANRGLESANREMRERNRKLVLLSETDALTGVANRRRFEERCAEEFARIGRSGGSLGLVMLDIDHFKRFNDVHGHAVGDRVLRDVADALEGELRRYDLVARLGGEEFGVLLPQTAGPGARAVAERCRAAVEALDPGLRRAPRRVSVSGGIACHPAPGVDSVEVLMRRADRALYRAKKQGRNRILESDPRGGRAEADAGR